MCGIAYVLSNTNANSVIKQIYKNQKSRGQEGFGFVANVGHPKLVRKTGEYEVLYELSKVNAGEILFHHRYPTSTDNVKNACHPFKIIGNKSHHVYYVVHNGIIWNDDDLKEKHDKLGIKYSSLQKDGSFNDSESLAYELVRCFEGEQKKCEAEGSIAFIVQEYNTNGKPVNLYFGRNSGSPLEYRKSKKGTVQISSEAKGRSTTIPENLLHVYNYKTRQTKTRKFTLKESYSYKKDYGYEEFYESGYLDRFGDWHFWSEERVNPDDLMTDRGYVKNKDGNWVREREPEFDESRESDTDYKFGFEDGKSGDVVFDIETCENDVRKAREDLFDLYDKLNNAKSKPERDETYGDIRVAKQDLNYFEGFLAGTKCAERKGYAKYSN